MLAWALLTTTLLLVRSGSIQPIWAAGLLIVTISVVLRARQPFGHSRSTRALLSRARQAAAGASIPLHRLPGLRNRTQPVAAYGNLLFAAVLAGLSGFVVGLASNQSLLLLPILLLALGYAYLRRQVWLQVLALVALYMVLLGNSSGARVADLSLLVLLVSLALAWYQRRWSLLGPAIFGGYLIVNRTFPDTLAYVLVFATLYGVSALLVTAKRLPSEREAVRTVLTFAYALATLLLLEYAPAYSPAPIVLGLLAAALAWRQHGRESYAKYFFLIAVYLFLTVTALFFSPGWLVLAGLIVASGLLAAGSSLDSYTLRLAGLATIGGALAIYVGEILPLAPNLHANPVLNRIGLGLLFAISLPILADWYAGLSLEPFERRLASWLSGALTAISALLTFALILMQTEIWLQSVLLISLSGIVLAVAHRRGWPLLRTAAGAAFVAALLKLVAVDAALLPSRWQYGIWLAAAALVSALLWRRSKLVDPQTA